MYRLGVARIFWLTKPFGFLGRFFFEKAGIDMNTIDNQASTTADVLVIGFGKAGKTIAMNRAEQGDRVILVEQSPKMYGGTCINIACIPTKILAHDALQGAPYKDAVERKNKVVEKLREKNYKSLADNDQVTIYKSEAIFRSDKEVEVEVNGKKEILTADHVVINTGSVSNIPPMKGDIDSDKVYTSTSLIERKELPEKLAIVGGGYIGLEYASMYRNFGSEVTVITPEKNCCLEKMQKLQKKWRKNLKKKG